MSTPAEDDIRAEIAKSLSGRCNNCYSKLEGYNVHGPGWNWISGNLGPFCDLCFEDVKALKEDLKQLRDAELRREMSMRP